MILILAFVFLITFFCFGTGFLWYRFQSATAPLINILFSGLIIITCISQAVNIIIPLDSSFFTTYGLFLLVALLFQRKSFFALTKRIFYNVRRADNWLFFTGAAFLLMILTQASGPIIMDDTESYHMQLVIWAKSYPVVPGLANLHERYGFQSAWFSAAAFFFQGPSHANLYASLNATISCWFSLYCIYLALNRKTVQPALSFALILLLIIFVCSWPIIRGGSANLNYDLVGTLLITIFIIQQVCSLTDGKTIITPTEWILWPAFLFTVRITHFPFLLPALAALVAYRKQVRTILPACIVSAVLCAALLTRNYITSGYLFFPSMAFNVFNPDWKVEASRIESLLEFIRYYNRVADHLQEIQVTKNQGALGWVPAWFQHLAFLDKALVMVALPGLLIISITIKKLPGGNKRYAMRALVLTLLLSLVCWMLIAPDPRFAYASLAIAGVGFIVLATKHWIGRVPASILSYSLGVVALLLITYTGHKIITNVDYRNPVHPVTIPSPPVRVININGMPFYIPEAIRNNWNARCFASPLPCLYEVRPGLTPRGKSLSDGFKIKND